MKNFKSIIASFLSIIILFQSCAAYSGKYSLDTAVSKGKKVRVKCQYNESLLYTNKEYIYNRINDYDAWEIVSNKFSTTGLSEIQDSTSINLSKIILFNGNYFGFNDFDNQNSWVKINSSEILEISTIKKREFKKLVYQEGNYWGITENNGEINLVLLDVNKVKNISQYDPALSALASIIAAPFAVSFFVFLILYAINNPSDD